MYQILLSETHGICTNNAMIDTNFNVTPVTTGTMGLLGNLWAGEIQEQLIHAQMQKASRGWIRKLVFLGSDKSLNRL